MANLPKPFVLYPITIDESTTLTETANNVFYAVGSIDIVLMPIGICINGFVIIVSNIDNGMVNVISSIDDGSTLIATLNAGESIILIANRSINFWDIAMSSGGGSSSVQGLAISDASDGATAPGDNAIAVGNLSIAGGDGTIAIGGALGTSGANASGNAAIAIGGNSNTGAGAQSSGLGAIAIGGGTANASSAQATGDGSIHIGVNDNDSKGALAAGAIAIGPLTTASGANAIAVGFASTNTGVNTVAIGADTSAINANAVAIGYAANITGSADNSIAIGYSSQCTAVHSITISTNGLVNNQGGSIIMGTASEMLRVNPPNIGNTVCRQQRTNIDTPSATQILGGIVTLPNATSITLPTAVDIDAAVTAPYIGMSFDCLFVPAIGNALTISGNTNTTVSGIATGATGQALIVRFYRSANTPVWLAFIA